MDFAFFRLPHSDFRIPTSSKCSLLHALPFRIPHVCRAIVPPYWMTAGPKSTLNSLCLIFPPSTFRFPHSIPYAPCPMLCRLCHRSSVLCHLSSVIGPLCPFCPQPATRSPQLVTRNPQPAITLVYLQIQTRHFSLNIVDRLNRSNI